MVIYLDLLIIIALLTNGSIFYLAGKLAAAEMRAWRLILADILAAMMTAALLSRYGVYLTSVWGKNRCDAYLSADSLSVARQEVLL